MLHEKNSRITRLDFSEDKDITHNYKIIHMEKPLTIGGTMSGRSLYDRRGEIISSRCTGKKNTDRNYKIMQLQSSLFCVVLSFICT